MDAMVEWARLLPWRRDGGDEAGRGVWRASEGDDAEDAASPGTRRGGKDAEWETEHWLRDAAEAGDTAAMEGLRRLLLEDGRHEEADHWFHRASEAGNTELPFRVRIEALAAVVLLIAGLVVWYLAG